MLGTVCVCAQPPRNGMSQGDTGELFFFLEKKEPMVIRELVRFGPSHLAAWQASLLFDSEEAGIRARQRGFQLLHGGWFSGPRVEGSEVRLLMTFRQTT